MTTRSGAGRALAALLAAALPATAGATSHREAPFVAEHPRVDGTDFYAFRSYQPGRDAFVTFIANYQPLQDNYSGPGYFPLDPDALYEIHVDNNGDCAEDLTFQFRFDNTLRGTTVNVDGRQVASPFLLSGPVSAASQSGLNMDQTYTVRVVRGGRRAGSAASVTEFGTGNAAFTKPFDFVGNKTFGSAAGYRDYSLPYVYNVNIPGCPTPGKVFVGQRDDNSGGNWGEFYDLMNTNLTGPENGERDIMAGKSATTIAIEVPIACLANPAGTPIGAWTTASLRQARLLDPTPTFESPTREGGAWTQVSRVGAPLVNAWFIGYPDKDAYNASKPANDSRFLDYITHPAFPEIVEGLHGFGAPQTPRNDLVATLMTGIPGMNQTAGTCEMLRLNTTTPVTPVGSQNRMGALACIEPGPNANLSAAGCDPAGYPNGRRPGDDVVDITLRLAMGAALPAGQAPSGGQAFTDGYQLNETFYTGSFPYHFTPHVASPSN